MKATAFEFRFRVGISFVIILLGFWAPWVNYLHWKSHVSTWLWLGVKLSSLGITSTSGILVVTGLVIAVAAAAAVLRVWGTACLGPALVNSDEMETGKVLADGPYRHVRNPLYLGSWLMIAAIAVLMPPSGAALSLLLLALFLLRIVLGEEAFLTDQLGDPYLAYKRAVSRLLPSLWPRVPASGQSPRWSYALLSEITPLGVLIVFLTLSWQFNADLLIRAILVSFGLSLVVRALLPPRTKSFAPSS